MVASMKFIEQTSRLDTQAGFLCYSFGVEYLLSQ